MGEKRPKRTVTEHMSQQNRIVKNKVHKNAHKDTLCGIRTDILLCLFLCLITLIVFWQVTNHEFINYDDDKYVSGNDYVIDGLTPENILWSFTAEVVGNWHPLTLLSHMLDCQLHGLDPGPHHLSNLFLHMANTLLLFLVLMRMTSTLWQSAFVAALFALHPLHVESVAWVAERKGVLSTFFWMLTMWCYVRYVESPKVERYLLVLLVFMMGLMAKPMLVTLPFVLLLLDYWPLRRFEPGKPGIGRLVLEKTPLFALSAASCVAVLHFQQSGGAFTSLAGYPVDIRVYNAIVSYIYYIFKTIWPIKLTVFYPHPGTLSIWQVSGAGLLLLAITFFSIRTVQQRPWVTVGWLWYMGTLVPVIGLVQVGSQAMADRYTYVPLIGIFIIITWGFPELLSRLRYKKAALASISSAVLITLTTLTWMQVRYWRNSISLFEYALHVTADNYIAHSILGSSLADQGKTAEAVRHYYEALRINPGHATAHYNLGCTFANQGMIAKAIRHFTKAVQIDPEFAEAHNNLGVAFANEGRFAEAAKYFSEALRINPEDPETHVNLGNTFAHQGKTAEAIRQFYEALRINPASVPAHNGLGIVLAKQGRIEEAIRHFSEALRLDPADVTARNKLKWALTLQEK